MHVISDPSLSQSGLGPPRSRSGSVLTSVSLDHEYAYLKRDKCINTLIKKFIVKFIVTELINHNDHNSKKIIF